LTDLGEKMQRIYFDHSATTPVDPEVIREMLPYFTEKFGNASSLHSFGREARYAMENARSRVAMLIGASPEEVIFTSGGTESDNIAIKGIAFRSKSKGNHIITTKIEHPAVLATCRWLERQGFAVSYLPVASDGVVSPEDARAAITEKTILISIMHANNEIGTIQPIEEIGRMARERGIAFHTDAVQSVGKIPVDVKKMNIDLLSLSSHKIYGPKGAGALYIRKGVFIDTIIHGGGHERGLRSSTENIPGIVGLGKACELAQARMAADGARLSKMRDRIIKTVLGGIEESYLNGHPTKRLPHNAHFRFTGIEGESLLLRLDEKGIAVSTGSACSSKSLEPSHVLTSIGLNPVDSHGSLRVTLGRENTEEEMDYFLKVLPEVVKELRAMSPVWQHREDIEKWKKTMEKR